jgi:hypothetical protein
MNRPKGLAPKLLLSAVLCVGVVGAGVTTAGAKNKGGAARAANAAVIVDRRAGGPVAHKVAWSIKKVNGGVVASNLASAQAVCDGCRATAAAVQIVFVSNLTGKLAASNKAAAVNLRCKSCTTDAVAYQFVLASTGKIWLTGQGWGQLQGLSAQLVAVARSGLPSAQLQARMVGIIGQVVGVLQAQVRVEAAPRAMGNAMGRALAASGPGYQLIVRKDVSHGLPAAAGKPAV